MRAIVANLGLALALLAGAADRVVASPDDLAGQSRPACSADSPDLIRPAMDGSRAPPSLRAGAIATESASENVDRTVPNAPSARVADIDRTAIRHSVAAAQARGLAIAWLDYARLLAAAHAGPPNSGTTAQPPPATRP